MASEHARAVRAAFRTSDRLDSLFDDMGHAEAPRGAILSAYRQARRALAGNVERGNVVNDVLSELRRSVQLTMTTLTQQAVQTGIEQAERELTIYGLAISLPELTAQIDSASSAWLSTLDAQLAGVRTLAMIGGESEILGDDNRTGLLTPGPVTRDGARWLAQLAALAWAQTVTRTAGEDEWYKQAVAAIDRRTTDCCLRVHGQTQPLNKPFRLTGEPRYADEIDWPGFHWWCRTATALVPRSQARDETTLEMERMAKSALAQRENNAQNGN